MDDATASELDALGDAAESATLEPAIGVRVVSLDDVPPPWTPLSGASRGGGPSPAGERPPQAVGIAAASATPITRATDMRGARGERMDLHRPAQQLA